MNNNLISSITVILNKTNSSTGYKKYGYTEYEEIPVCVYTAPSAIRFARFPQIHSQTAFAFRLVIQQLKMMNTEMTVLKWTVLPLHGTNCETCFRASKGQMYKTVHIRCLFGGHVLVAVATAVGISTLYVTYL